MWNHTPRKEKDELLTDGEYDAIIERIEETMSRAGHPMLAIRLSVEGHMVMDYVVASEATAWRVRRFCEGLGLDYDSGAIDTAALEGARIRVHVTTEPASGDWPAKNRIDSYSGIKQAALKGKAEDDCPF